MYLKVLYGNVKAMYAFNETVVRQIVKLLKICKILSYIAHPIGLKLLIYAFFRFRSRVAQGREGRGSPGPQKPASNMLELTWDNELELIGQR